MTIFSSFSANFFSTLSYHLDFHAFTQSAIGREKYCLGTRLFCADMGIGQWEWDRKSPR